MDGNVTVMSFLSVGWERIIIGARWLVVWSRLGGVVLWWTVSSCAFGQDGLLRWPLSVVDAAEVFCPLSRAGCERIRI